MIGEGKLISNLVSSESGVNMEEEEEEVSVEVNKIFEEISFWCWR